MHLACDSEVFLKGNIYQSREDDEEQIKRIYNSGFRNVNYAFYSEPRLMKDGWREYFKSQREIFDKYGISVSIAHSSVNGDYDKLDDYYDEMAKRTIEACGILGCKWLVSHPKNIECDYTKDDIKNIKEKNIEYYKKYTKLLEKHNVGLAIENLLDTIKRRWKVGTRVYCDNIQDLIDLVDGINHEKVGICIDTGHLNTYSGVDIYEELEKVGNRLKALHVNDNDGIDDLHNIPYLGTINWKRIMDVLKKINYQGDFSYEASGILKKFPDDLKEKLLKFKYEVGEYILGL